ncbi:MAG: hypothetical protein ACTS44_01205 [Candidatus Hodgkinia cicadicola]
MLNLTQRSSITPHGRAIFTSEGIAPLRWDCGALMPSVHGRVSFNYKPPKFKLPPNHQRSYILTFWCAST